MLDVLVYNLKVVEYMNVCMYVWMDGCMDGCMYVYMYVCMDRWIDRWMGDRWMDG